jgi:hypothetical protein
MPKVRLVTADNALVHETEIPPFNEPPKVVGWGDRVFLVKHLEIDGAILNPAVKVHGVNEANQKVVMVYEEVFAYAIVT